VNPAETHSVYKHHECDSVHFSWFLKNLVWAA